ncbi:MAG: hypothetical protein KC613_01435 [Myxococcales bacterium]|nr:hypothetical protein [Myxococcales bacterium]MCB9523384.1 hypothetical protein [Myxococcales bacterium]
MTRNTLRWLAPFALFFACTASEDGYQVQAVEQEGDACVTALGYAALTPGRATSGTTARELAFDVRFDCGVPVHITGLTCPDCESPEKIEAQGLVRLVKEMPVPVGKEDALTQEPLWLRWRSDDGLITGSLQLNLTYEPAEEGAGCL